jgi:hypothetical protein
MAMAAETADTISVSDSDTFSKNARTALEDAPDVTLSAAFRPNQEQEHRLGALRCRYTRTG